MERICKQCATKVNFEYGEKTTFCPRCEKEITLKDAMAQHTLDARTTQLKAMHMLMLEANDESIYMTWICTMPDCPSEEDFMDIALDDEQYNECFDLFVKLIADKDNRY
jgi:hypothetical protein